MEPDKMPALLDVTRAAIDEGHHLLGKLSHGYVTIGAGDIEAEVVRALMDSTNALALAMIGTVDELKANLDRGLKFLEQT